MAAMSNVPGGRGRHAVSLLSHACDYLTVLCEFHNEHAADMAYLRMSAYAMFDTAGSKCTWQALSGIPVHWR